MNLPKPPVGVTSTLILMALDGVWGAGEVGATATVVGTTSLPFLSASVFALCFMTVTFLQRYIEKDEWGAALAKGLACGVLAGVPYPVFGAGAGAALLGWAGMRRLGGGGEDEPKQLEGGKK